MAFDRLDQILFWPLELSARGTPDPSFIKKSADQIVCDSTNAWKDLDPYDRKTTQSAELKYAEFVYFHPFVRRFLYPTTQMGPMRILARNDIRNVRVKLSGVREELLPSVERVNLYLFQTQVAILVVEVNLEGKIERQVAMEFLDQFRRVYSPYWFNGRGGHCPEKVEWLDQENKPVGSPSNFDDFEEQHKSVENKNRRRPPVAAHWQSLISVLKPSVNDPESDVLYFDQIEDDRMPAMCFLGHPEPHSITDADMVRLCYWDSASESSDEYPYSPQFLSDFAKHCYDRYWDKLNPKNSWMTTRYLCCGYAFTIIGCSTNKCVMDEKSGLLAHFRHHYFQLGLLAHFHRSSLLRFSRRFSNSIREYEAKLDHAFADFATGYWFNEVSNQTQGQELFQLWSEQLGNQKLMDHVVREKRLTAQLEEAEQIRRDGEQVKILTAQLAKLTHVLVPLTIAAVLVAYLDMDFTREHLRALKEGHFWLMLAALLVILVVSWCVVAWPRQRKDNRDLRG